MTVRVRNNAVVYLLCIFVVYICCVYLLCIFVVYFILFGYDVVCFQLIAYGCFIFQSVHNLFDVVTTNPPLLDLVQVRSYY